LAGHELQVHLYKLDFSTRYLFESECHVTYTNFHILRQPFVVEEIRTRMYNHATLQPDFELLGEGSRDCFLCLVDQIYRFTFRHCVLEHNYNNGDSLSRYRGTYIHPHGYRCKERRSSTLVNPAFHLCLVTISDAFQHFTKSQCDDLPFSGTFK